MDETKAQKEQVGSIRTMDDLRVEASQKMPPPSDAFLASLPEQYSGDSVQCHCKRLFVTINYSRDDDWEERRRWAEKQAEQGRTVIISDNDVAFVELDYVYVLRCPCNGLYRYQNWIDCNAEWLMRYILNSPRCITEQQLKETTALLAEYSESAQRLHSYNKLANSAINARNMLRDQVKQCARLKDMLETSEDCEMPDIKGLPTITHLEVMRREADEAIQEIKQRIDRYATLIASRQMLLGTARKAIQLKATLDQMGDLPTRAIDFDDEEAKT